MVAVLVLVMTSEAAASFEPKVLGATTVPLEAANPIRSSGEGVAATSEKKLALIATWLKKLAGGLRSGLEWTRGWGGREADARRRQIDTLNEGDAGVNTRAVCVAEDRGLSEVDPDKPGRKGRHADGRRARCRRRCETHDGTGGYSIYARDLHLNLPEVCR